MKAQFKIRCSAIGQIMTDSRTKSEPLSKTAQSYLQTWAKEQIYGRKHEITTKYMQKGIEGEAAAIEFVSKHLYSGNMLIKNEQQFENEYMIGTPDLIFPDIIPDIKCSWDCFTFPLFETEPNKAYYWQMQGYMDLTGRSQAKVIHVLINTPEELVEKEIYYALGDNYNPDIEEQIRLKHNYDDVPARYRIKVFDIYRNQLDTARIIEKVMLCQDYINQL